MVHRRQVEVGGETETLIFGVHGALWGNAMTWWDHSTGSIWSQPLGEAIVGPRTGQRLDLLSFQFTSWESWRDQHPSTLALAVDSGPSRFDLADFLLVVDFRSEARGYRVPDLQGVGVVNDVVAGVEIAVVVDPDRPDRWSVFSRRLDDRIVELGFRGNRLVDSISGTTFDPVHGTAVDGPLAGEILDRLPALTSFPGDFDTFWPDGTVWAP